MLLNYLKLGFRLLRRNPFFTFVNLLGLSTGFAIFFMLWQYTGSELKTDAFHQDAHRIYRLGYVYRWFNAYKEWGEFTLGTSPTPYAQYLQEKYTDVESYSSVVQQQNFNAQLFMHHGSEVIVSSIDASGRRIEAEEKNLMYADANFFTFFKFPLRSGDPEVVLKSPRTVVLSENSAQKYFGATDPVGKMIYLNDSLGYTVSGIFERLPRNTHFNFDMVFSAPSDGKQYWGDGRIFLKLREGVDYKKLEARFKSEKDLWRKSEVEENIPFLQPLLEVPYAALDGESFQPRSKQALNILSLVPFVILIMAWVNYINLSISANSARMKEIAARKTIGARRTDFLKQFISEAVILNFLSLLLAAALVLVLRGAADRYFQFYLPPLSETPFTTFVLLILIAAAGAVLSGLYPTLVTLRRSPASLMGKQAAAKGGGNPFTYALTTIQYASAVILIIWVFSLSLEVDLILNQSMGIDENGVVIVEAPRDTLLTHRKMNTFTRDLRSIEGVAGATMSHSITGDRDWARRLLRDNGIFPRTNGGVDENFIPFYRIPLLAGRNFRPDEPSESDKMIISSAWLQYFKFESPEAAVGQKIAVFTSPGRQNPKELEVIGVIRGYRQETLYAQNNTTRLADFENPTIFLTYKDYVMPTLVPRRFSVRIEPDHFQKTIDDIKSLYATTFAGENFNWYFLDDRLRLPYEAEKITRNQIMFFAAIAIAIACLGFLGVISSKVREKTKEIGVRKVLGAGSGSIIRVLLNATLWQLLIAVVIGIPVAHYLVKQYLQKFMVQIELSWWQFALPVMILIFIMGATIATMLMRAARSNPVDALRYD